MSRLLRVPVRTRPVVLAVVMLTAACSEGARPEFDDASPSSTAPSTPTTPAPDPADTNPADTADPDTTTARTDAPEPAPPAPNGRHYPSVPADLDVAAARLYEVEAQIHELEPDVPEWPDLAHEQQMLYRTIARTPERIPDVVADAPPELRAVVERHLEARRSIGGIGGSNQEPPANVPAWHIIEPLPAEALRVLYEQASADTGIHWTYLAAINLLETGYGRIDGLSTAGAQGPMQFLPTTFVEVSDGDIDDPRDAIPAAARYLVRRGGPDDMRAALWGYNNSDDYVDAITHYADLFREDEQSFLATHAWEIHYSAAAGDLWFPLGYLHDEAQPVEQYLAEAPWSAPPPRS